MSAGIAWYVKDRDAFVRDPVQIVVGQLASAAASEGLHVEQFQHEEWHSSVGVLQRELTHRSNEIKLLKTTLAAKDLDAFRHVLLEFDFRRRGLRMDCVLLGDGVIAVVEFKRSIDSESSILKFMGRPSYGDDGSNRHEIVVA